MDLSDDIAYSVHDFEDAIVNEYIDPAFLSARAGHDSLIRAVQAWAGDSFSVDDMAEAFDRLAGYDVWMTGWDASRRDLGKLKNFTSQMIGHFSQSATQATREAYPQSSLIRFGASVIVPHEVQAEIAVLKGVVAAFVMASDARQPIYRQQRDILTDLAEGLFQAGPDALDRGFADDWEQAADDAARKRVVVDQVASLTDQSALAWHERLTIPV